jgi:hypothetical protein
MVADIFIVQNLFLRQSLSKTLVAAGYEMRMLDKNQGPASYSSKNLAFLHCH